MKVLSFICKQTFFINLVLYFIGNLKLNVLCLDISSHLSIDNRCHYPLLISIAFQGRTAKIAKPVGKQTTVHSSKSLFPSQAKPFVPTVTSTSKANFNFSAISKKKSPAPSRAQTTTKSPAAARNTTKLPASSNTTNIKAKSPAVQSSKTPKQRKTVVAKRTVAPKTPSQRPVAKTRPAAKVTKTPARKSPRLSGT